MISPDNTQIVEKLDLITIQLEKIYNENNLNKIESLEKSKQDLLNENIDLKIEIKKLKIKLKEKKNINLTLYRYNPNDYLFFEVWRNLYLRNEIYKHVHIYKIHGNKTINTLESLRTMEYRCYLINLTFTQQSGVCEIGDIPSSVNKIIIKDAVSNYFINFKENSIPDSVKSLFGCFNLQGIPPSLTELTFSNYFNQFIASLPNSITSLSLGCYFNQIISPGILPNSLTYLEFSNKFNKSLPNGVIPNNVKTIIFGEFFNQDILPGSLPYGLKSLTFKNGQERYISLIKVVSDFNKPFKIGSLPHSLTHLSLNHDYSERLPLGVLPISLTYLELGNNYNFPIEAGLIPPSVTTIVIPNKSLISHDSIPISVKIVK